VVVSGGTGRCAIDEDDTTARDNAAYLGERHGLRQIRQQRHRAKYDVTRHGRRECVVITTARDPRQRIDPDVEAGLDQLGRQGQVVARQLDTDTAGGRDVTQVGDEAVGDVDHRCRAGFRQPQRSRVGDQGPTVRVGQGCAIVSRREEREAGRGVAEPAGYDDDIARLGTGSRHRSSAVQVTQCGHCHHQHRRSTDITTDDLGVDNRALVTQAVGEAVDPGDVEIGRRSQPYEQRRRRGSHRRDVGKVLRSRLAADVIGGRPVPPEVRPFHQQVGARDDTTVARRDDGGVIAGTEQCTTPGQPRDDTRDQAELTGVGNRDVVSFLCPIASRMQTRIGQGVPVTVQAYILIQTEVGKAAAVAAEIAGLKGVTMAEDVTGPYDVIVRAEARNVDELGKLVVAKVQGVPGITRTLTCPVVHL
jgi:DNA-binding Lrp family transcriptional regulator